MSSLYSLGVNGKTYRLIYKMNEKVNIQVKTPVGTSESEVTNVVTQGGVDALLISSSNVAVGIKEAFEDSDKEVTYFELKLSPQSFMDDIMRLAENVESAQYGNDAMEDMINRKVLKSNIEKSDYVIIGNKTRRKLKDELKKNPLKICGEDMEEAKSVKYLEDRIS